MSLRATTLLSYDIDNVTPQYIEWTILILMYVVLWKIHLVLKGLKNGHLCLSVMRSIVHRKTLLYGHFHAFANLLIIFYYLVYHGLSFLFCVPVTQYEHWSCLNTCMLVLARIPCVASFLNK